MSRQVQAQRALGRISVRIGKSKVQVDPGVVARLSAFVDRASIRTLSWGARQATLLRALHPDAPDPSGSGKTLPEAFVLGFGEVLDWAAISLVLHDGRAQRVNLLSMTGEQAWLSQISYHAALQTVKDGRIQIPEGQEVFSFAAFLGVGPGMLRQINARNLASRRPGDWIWIVAPRPLEHRIVLAEYKDGVAWVWIKPGTDKDRVGRNIGLCISASGWDHRLQFALVDAENRPHAVLTMDPVQFDDRARGVGDANRFVRARGGRAVLDLGTAMNEGILLAWGECKGRFNRRPVPDPYRRYAIALATSGLLGPMTISPTRSTAAADWASLLLTDLTPSKALPLWRKVGGNPAVFSVADRLRPTTMGDGGPNEQTLNYFAAAPIDQWLATPLAPLVLAASSNDELHLIWRDGERARAVRSEALRVLRRRRSDDIVFWTRQLPHIERAGLLMPGKGPLRPKYDPKDALQSMRVDLRRGALYRRVVKLRDKLGIKSDTAHGIYVELLRRGDPRVLSVPFVASLFKYIADEDMPGAIAAVVETFEAISDAGSARALFERTVQRSSRYGVKPPSAPMSDAVTPRFLALAADTAASASEDVVHRQLTTEERAQILELYPEDFTDDLDEGFNRHGLLSLLMGEDGWQGGGHLGADLDSVGLAAALYGDFGESWQIHFGAPWDLGLAGLVGFYPIFDSDRTEEVLHGLGEGRDLSDVIELWGAFPAVVALAVFGESAGNHNYFEKVYSAGMKELPRWVQVGFDRLIRLAKQIEQQPTVSAVEHFDPKKRRWKPSALTAEGMLPLEKWWAAHEAAQELVNPVREALGLPPDEDFPPSSVLSHRINQLKLPGVP